MEVNIRDQKYSLQINYQQDEKLRLALNTMTQEFWGFDFESFYQSSYWEADTILYSLFQNNEIVAHLTVSIFDARLADQTLRLAQVGTVMTSEKFRNRGLARFLMQYSMDELGDQIDGIFLFANDTVLDFYPKFGLQIQAEYQASMPISSSGEPTLVRKLDLDNSEDLARFDYYITHSKRNAVLETKNKGITYFYCLAHPEFGYKDAILYIPTLQVIAIVQKEDTCMTIFHLFQLQNTDLKEIVQILSSEEIKTVNFGFTPLTDAVQYNLHQEEDLTLFISTALVPFFENQKLMIPLLAHT